eukprot:PITA_26239
MAMQPQVTFETFAKWGIEFVGPINPPSKQKKYIIMCTDYLTKWAETKVIKTMTEKKVAEFLIENIFYKFGYLRELVIDQGGQFTSSLIEDLLTHHKIKHMTSTPYHPEANGQVEGTNRALEGILTKVVSSSRKEWVDRLVEATWAYNTTWKTAIGFTPYELVYGKKALLLQALLHIEVVQLQRKIWHDRNIREKQFQEGDWALLYDSRYMDFKGMLRTRWMGPYIVEKCKDNGSVLIRTIDDEAIPMLVNGHRLKVFKKPLSKREFIEDLNKIVMVVEHVLASTSPTH